MSTPTTPSANLDAKLAQVRKLINLAEHPGTPEHEASAARLKADAIMFEHGIEQATLRNALPPEARVKPITITVDLGTGDAYLLGFSLISKVAEHCRCYLRTAYVRSDDYRSGGYVAHVYGYEADVRYAELLFTTLRLHMLGAVRPEIEANLTLDENAYRLHNAGYNWLEIGEKYGWRKVGYHWNREAGKVIEVAYRIPADNPQRDNRKLMADRPDEDGYVYVPHTTLGGHFKRAYYRATEARGEQGKKLAAGGTDGYRADAASGYLIRIGERLRGVAASRTPGTDIVFAGSREDLLNFFREAAPKSFTRCPSCELLSKDRYSCDRCGEAIADAPPEAAPCPKCAKNPSGRCKDHPYYGRSYRGRAFNEAAYDAGRAHANTADLGGGVGGSAATPIR